MAAHASSRQSYPLLITAYLAVVLFGIGALIWWIWPDSKATANSNSFIAAETAGAYDSPSDFKQSKDVRAVLREQATPDQSASRAIQLQLNDLQRYIRNLATKKASVRPKWIGKSFVGVGVEPKKFPVKYKDSVTTVSRYRGTDTAPQFSGNQAFQQFIANTLVSVVNCDNFWIDIRLEKLKQSGDQFTATLLAESVGSREQNTDEREQSGNLRKVLQVSSVWETTWSKQEGSDFQLLTAKVPAAEMVAFNLNAPQLFFDCTDSIIGDNSCLRKQLAYGVDQWASKLPGIDTQGNFGLSIGDVNNDGIDDVYLCQPQGIANRLFIQRRNGTAVEESLKYGVNLLDESRSSLFVDLDNDGDQDLVVATKSGLVLMTNTGEGRYEIINKLDRCGDGLSLSAADYDNDGDIDLFLSRQAKPQPSVRINNSATNLLAGSLLLRNDSLFRFVDVTGTVGLVDEQPLSARSAVWFDRDLDGDQDLYVTSGDSGGVQFVNADGVFSRASDMVANSLPDQQSASTGDFNGDGRFDLLVASKSEFGETPNIESHVSFGGQADSTKPFFLRSPLFDNQYATSSLVADLNNDGRDDLVIGNGGLTRVALEDLSWLFPPPKEGVSDAKNKTFLEETKLEQYSIYSRQKNRCYASIGTSGFAEVSSASGLNIPDDTRALAATDWDHDGDVDILVVNRTGPQLRFFINALGRPNSISFRLTGETSNRDAIGARVELKLQGVAAPLMKTIQAGGGFLSQSSKRLTFGVGEAQKIESVVVRWPSGKVHQFKQLGIGATYDLAEGNADLVERLNNRYRLKINPSNPPSSLRQPLPDERTLFVPRFPLPSPEAQVASGKWNRLKTSGEQPSIFLFWGQNAQSTTALEQLNRFVGELEEAKATVVTVFTDSSELRPDEQWKFLSNTAENLSEIKNWTSLSNGGLETMKIVFGHWFGKRELPESPFALLIDKQSHVVGLYPVDAFRKEQLLSDLKLCDQAVALADEPQNDDGFWATPVLPVDSRELANRLDWAGFGLASKQLLATCSGEIADDLKNEAKDFAALGRYDAAEQYFEAALKEDPNNISALLGRSNLAIDLTLAARNQSDPDQTSVENPAIAVSGGGLSLAEAKAGLERVLEIDPEQWQAATGIAKILLLQDQPNKALKTLEEYQKINPRVEVVAMQGRVLFQAGSYTNAKHILFQAYDEDPDLPYLAGDLGYLYLIDEEPKEARKLLRKAHRLHPSDLTFLRLLAEAEFLMGNFSGAVDLFTQVNQLQPDQLRSKNVLAWLLATCPFEDKRDGVAALALIDTGSENLVEQDAATLEIYAACYAEVGQFDKAVQFQQEAVKKLNNESISQNSSQNSSTPQFERLELYRMGQAYHTADTKQMPIKINGSRLTEGGFRALRF